MSEPSIHEGTAVSGTSTASAGGTIHQHGMMDVSGPLMVWTWVTFAVVSALLYKVAWKPILRALEQREGRIRRGLEDADTARRAAENAEAEADRVRAAARDEARNALEQSRLAADAAARQIAERARAEGRGMVESARREIEREAAHARTALRQESADLAVALAKKMLGETMTPERHREFTDRMLGNG